MPHNKPKNSTVSIATFLLGASILCSCSSLEKAQNDPASLPTTYIIPAGYEGTLRIMYEEPCGIEPTVESGHQVLVFPGNGILVLKGKNNYVLNKKTAFFFKDSVGNRTPIEQVIDQSGTFTTGKDGVRNYIDRGNTTIAGRDAKRPVVIVGGVGVHFLEVLNYVNGELTNKNKVSVEYRDYFVYNKKKIDTANFKTTPALHIAAENLVKACRAEHLAVNNQ